MTSNQESSYKDKFVVGVDFGGSVTGLALGKNGFVSPIRSVESKDVMTVIKEIIRHTKEQKASAVVLGLPLTVDQKETAQSIEVRRFAKLLKSHIGVPVLFMEEYGSTQEAVRDAIEGELPQKARSRVDSLSAAIILKRFFSREDL
ncbi:MAG: Holliday junction resolvase RuvX [bacterium]